MYTSIFHSVVVNIELIYDSSYIIATTPTQVLCSIICNINFSFIGVDGDTHKTLIDVTAYSISILYQYTPWNTMNSLNKLILCELA